MFNWKTATDNELAKYLATLSANNVAQQVFYWKGQGNIAMLDKIERCKPLAKKWKILYQAQKLGAIIPDDLIV